MSPMTKAFETRVSADLKVRFGGQKTTSQRKEVQLHPVINALTISPENRDLRIHDGFFSWVASGVDDVVDDIVSIADEADAEVQDFLRTKAGRDLIELYVGNEDWLDADLDVLVEACVDGLCEAAAL